MMLSTREITSFVKRHNARLLSASDAELRMRRPRKMLPLPPLDAPVTDRPCAIIVRFPKRRRMRVIEIGPGDNAA